MAHSIRRAAISAAAFFLLSASIGSAMAQPQGKRIAYLTATTSNPFIAALASTIEKDSAAAGMQATVMTSPYDAALQSQQISDALAQKFDAIVVTPVSERGIVPALGLAKRAGVPVFIVNSPIAKGSDDLYNSFIGEDHEVLGRLAGEALIEAVKGRQNVKVALVTGSLAEGVAPRRLAGFKAAVAANPEIKIVATEDAKWDTAASERIAGQLFARFAAQGGLDAVYGMADNVAHGVIQAAKAAGVPLGTGKGQLVVVSSNCMKFGVDHIRAGLQYSTATQMPVRTGKAAVAAVVSHFQGKQVPKHNYLPMTVIAKHNVEQFAAACTY